MGERLEPEVDPEGFNASGETTRQERVANFVTKALSYIPGHPGADLDIHTSRVMYMQSGSRDETTTYEYRHHKTGELIRTKTHQHDCVVARCATVTFK